MGGESGANRERNYQSYVIHMSDKLLNMVSFISRDWKSAHDRPHHEALGKYSRLLCVEPPITIDTPIRKSRIFWERLTRRRGLRQYFDTLSLYKPLAFVPYRIAFEIPWLKWINKLLIRASLNKVLQKLNMVDVVKNYFRPNARLSH